ncbi:MAG: flagellar motor switch protein FliN [Caldimicrobium sp.]|nr:flagellar motor switch protein FliN [Caldimicrobium sp.]MCX7874096.1 flagellar motor switch protein FliN [Caldimicrobium sp.]MDW8093769.1 flagellar motor switch protein FliN [Caldimicrobium sp.]
MSEEKLENREEHINPDDLMAMWESALREAQVVTSKEEKSAEEIVSQEQRPSIKETQPIKLQELTPSKETGHPQELDFILDIPLEISVEIGRTRMLIKDLLKLNQGAIIELDKFAGEPVEIYVNGRLMAKGEVVVVNERFGVRITEIISAQDRIKRLGS